MDDYRWVKTVSLDSEPAEGHAIPLEAAQEVDGKPLLAQFYTAKCGRLVLLSADDQDLTDDDALCEGCVAAVQDPEQAAAIAGALPVVPVSGGEVVSAETDPVVVLVRKLPTVAVFPEPHSGESTRVVHIQPMRLDIAPPSRFRAYCGFLWTWDEVETVQPGVQAGAFCPDCWGLWIADREISRRAGGAS